MTCPDHRALALLVLAACGSEPIATVGDAPFEDARTAPSSGWPGAPRVRLELPACASS